MQVDYVTSFFGESKPPLTEEGAAVKLQAAFKGALVRKGYERLKATVIVQNAIRARIARKAAVDLKESRRLEALRLLAGPYLKEKCRLEQAEHPTSGKSRECIFLPSDVPIVIRKGREQVARYKNMYAAREICTINELTLLMVPRAVGISGYLIEEKVPSGHPGSIQGMWYYFTHQREFTKAISQVSTFLCKCTLRDIVGGNDSLLNLITTAKAPRFDNLLLFSTEGESEAAEYKIGMVDLETFDKPIQRPPSARYKLAAETAIQLFPYHLDTILSTIALQQEEALQEGFTKKVQEELHNLAAVSCELYRTVIADNLLFYQRHKIVPESPLRVEISLVRKGEIIEKAMRMLEEKGGFCGDLEEAKSYFQQTMAPVILEQMEEFLLASAGAPCNSYGALIEQRMLEHRVTCLFEQWAVKFSEQEGVDCINEVGRGFLFEFIFNELVEGGELAFYRRGIEDEYDLIFC